MKRYDLELTATGPVMEERKEGAFVPFAEVSGLADTVMKVGSRCTLLADLLRDANDSVYFHLESPDSRLSGEEAGKLIVLAERIADALAGKLPEPAMPKGWKLVEKANCFTLVSDGQVIASMAGPTAEGTAAILASVLDGKVPEQGGVNGFHLLREANHLRQEEWDIGSEKVSLSFLGNELAGETGELCNVLKKLERERIGIVGSRSTIEKAATELADVVICADLVARALGINTWDAVCNKFNYTSAKYGLKTMLFGTPNLIKQAARTITEGQEFELTTVLQAIASGFSDDPAHDAAALLKRITGEVPWTGDSFQIPPRQGGEPCATEHPSSSPD